MDIRVLFIIAIIIPVPSAALGTAGGLSALTEIHTLTDDNQMINQTMIEEVSDESLMNLVIRARDYALENGKMAALSAFSDRTTFFGNGMYVIAADMNGVILADPIQPLKVGTCAISHDHDTGIIMRLCDCAGSGGGLMEIESEKKPVAWYVCPVDESWWIAAVSGNNSPVY